MSRISLEAFAKPTITLALALRKEARRRELAANFKTSLIPGHAIAKLLTKRRYKVYYGGRGAIKSWGFAEALVHYCDAPLGKYIDRPERILCTREFQNSIKDSVHQLLRDTIERMGLDHRFYVTDREIANRVTGGRFIFKGLHNNVEGIKSTEGVTKCWVEEAQTVSADSWQTLIPTIRTPGSEIWVSLNVTDEEAPTHQRFILPPEPYPEDMAVIEHVNFDTNPYLPDELRREMEWCKKTDYEAYEHIWLGMAKKISDAIIFGGKYRVEGFSDQLYREALRAGNGLLFGLDHGFAKDPYALTRSFILNKKLYIEYEAFGVGVEFAGKMTKDGRGELEQLLDTVPGSRENLILADSSRPETISFLKGKGFRVQPADKWKGCVEDGIAHIKGFEEIIIHDRCKHMQQEARLYRFKKDRLTGRILPEVMDANNHGWDAVRYSLDKYIKRGGLGIWAKLAG